MTWQRLKDTKFVEGELSEGVEFDLNLGIHLYSVFLRKYFKISTHIAKNKFCFYEALMSHTLNTWNREQSY